MNSINFMIIDHVLKSFYAKKNFFFNLYKSENAKKMNDVKFAVILRLQTIRLKAPITFTVCKFQTRLREKNSDEI